MSKEPLDSEGNELQHGHVYQANETLFWILREVPTGKIHWAFLECYDEWGEMREVTKDAYFLQHRVEHVCDLNHLGKLLEDKINSELEK